MSHNRIHSSNCQVLECKSKKAHRTWLVVVVVVVVLLLLLLRGSEALDSSNPACSNFALVMCCGCMNFEGEKAQQQI